MASTSRYVCRAPHCPLHRFWTVHLVIHLIFMMVSANDNKTACSIPSVEPLHNTTITCSFPEDLSVSKKDFVIYHYAERSKPGDAVLDCWWSKGVLMCYTKSGFIFNNIVSTSLNVAATRMNSSHQGTYACQVAGYDHSSLGTCDFKLIDKGSGKGATEGTTLTVGIIVGIIVGVGILLILGIFLVIFLKRKRSAMNRGREDDEQQQVMLGWSKVNTSKGNKSKEKLGKKYRQLITQQFSDYLLTSVEDMFPDIMEGCFFVPPVYFNTTRYTTTIVADQVVNIPESPEASVVTHDKAVQRVLYCLRHWAEHRRENMFLVTQFKYEDYLNGDQAFCGHTLPKATHLVKKNKGIKCLDLMIIHRQHGILLGVVVDVALADDSRGEEEEDKTVLSHLSVAIQELKKADRDVSHVMSDLSQCLLIRKTLIFPHLSLSLLKRALEADVGLAEELRGMLNIKIFEKSASGVCMDFLQKISADRLQTLKHSDHSTCNLTNDPDDPIIKTIDNPTVSRLENPIRVCLCADHLSDPQTPSDVTPTVLEDLEQWWSILMPHGSDDIGMNDDLYLKVISRVCGPASTAKLLLPGDSEPVLLPKTLEQAVSLTGELFERLTLYSDMTDLLREPRLFLCGPPATGKTTMLMLAGRSWLLEGHDVYILKTSESRLEESLKIENFTRMSGYGARGQVFVYSVDIHDERSRRTTMKKICKHSGKKPAHIIADELECDTEEVRNFIEMTLNVNNNKGYLWITNSRGSSAPAGWRTEILTRAVRCPPAVVREASAILSRHLPDVRPYSPSDFPAPTDGPLVKHIYHGGQGHAKGQPRDCEQCAIEVANFLTRIIRTSQSDSEGSTRDVTQFSRGIGRQFSLHARDVMILFESEVDHMKTTMLKKLIEAGIFVDVTATPSAGESDVALAGEASRLRGEKRKVVVYVEDNVDNSDIWWTRLRGITSCYSQLIRVINSKIVHKAI